VTAVRHRPKITRRVEDGEKVYRFTCACGLEGVERASRKMAAADQADHLASLPKIPADQQCRDPQRHRTRWWERCPVCADQLPLPLEGLEGVCCGDRCRA